MYSGFLPRLNHLYNRPGGQLRVMDGLSAHSESYMSDTDLEWSGEQKLLGAMILRAVLDANMDIPESHVLRERYANSRKGRLSTELKNLRERQIAKFQALEWLLSKSMQPWSYCWCCEYLDVDPERLLEEIKERGALGGTPQSIRGAKGFRYKF